MAPPRTKARRGRTGRMLTARAGKTTAIHVQDRGASKHLVHFDDLHVVITNQDGSWFAQAIEVDYAAQGSSVEDAQRRFEVGFLETVNQHIEEFGTIRDLLAFVPNDVYQEIVRRAPIRKTYSQLSIHEIPELPFEKIQFIELKAA